MSRQTQSRKLESFKNRRRSASSPVQVSLNRFSSQNFAGTSANLSRQSDSDEVSPLLSDRFLRSHHGSITQPHHLNDIRLDRNHNELFDGGENEEETQSKYDLVSYFSISPNFSRSRFWWFVSLGFLAILTLHLSFLPRTSMSRDFRRWHGLRLTKADIKRSYLVFSGLHSITNGKDRVNEEQISDWLTNFTAINNQSPTNLLTNDNIDLISFVEDNFNKFGVEAQAFSYDVPHLQKPLGSSLSLLNSADQSVLYNAKLFEHKSSTPAYNVFGFNGSVTGNYVFVNEATTKDFQLLLKNRINPASKLVIAKTSKILSVAEQVQISQEYGASGFIVYQDVSSYNKQELKSLQSALSRYSVAFQPISHANNLTLPKIPSIPVSYKAIKPILDSLSPSSSKDFENWDHYPETEDSTLELNLNTIFSKEKPRKITNIVGSIKGVLNDGDVVIGASRDSMTSSDPLSNHAILFEIMRGFQKLVQLGWKPLRNIRFISWDGSHSGLLGSQLSSNDTDIFSTRKPILCYVNIDDAAVTGSKLKVDSNPLFNDLLVKTAKYIPFPKFSTHYKTLPKDDSDGNDDDDDDEEKYSTLHNYWWKQDKLFINNKLGYQLKESDAIVFQNHMSAPIINIKFENDPKRDSSAYLPNSNYYSYDWLTKQEIDDDMLLHGLLVRYIGLMIISLSEHEIVDIKSHSYFDIINQYFKNLLLDHNETFSKWSEKNVSTYLINKYSIYNDIRDQDEFDENNPIKFNDVIHAFQILLNDLFDQSKVFDDYLSSVQDSLIEDYAWYKYLKKVHIYAKFKVANYKILHFEKEFLLKSKDYTYLFGDGAKGSGDQVDPIKSKTLPLFDKPEELWFNHIFYGLPEFTPDKDLAYLASRDQLSVFPYLQQAILKPDYEQTVKWLVVTYDKLKNLHRKIA